MNAAKSVMQARARGAQVHPPVQAPKGHLGGTGRRQQSDRSRAEQAAEHDCGLTDETLLGFAL